MGTQEQLRINTNNKGQQSKDDFLNDIHVDVMARTLWGEARSEGVRGMEAVAHVILNRVEYARRNGGQYWWGNDVTTVCQRPYQFSCWNHSDPNRARIMALDYSDIHFQTCLCIARRAVYGQLGADITKGATHYHTFYVTPIWSRDAEPITIIGQHKFYDLGGK